MIANSKVRGAAYEGRINLSLDWPFVKLKTRRVLLHLCVHLCREWTWLKRKAEHKTADKDNRVAHEGV